MLLYAPHIEFDTIRSSHTLDNLGTKQLGSSKWSFLTALFWPCTNDFLPLFYTFRFKDAPTLVLVL